MERTVILQSGARLTVPLEHPPVYVAGAGYGASTLEAGRQRVLLAAHGWRES
jgi:hypothetical protein